MFDRGYLGVDPAHRLLVSPRLREDFGTARSSTPAKVDASPFPSTAATGHTASSSNGTWTPSSRPPEAAS
jgi:hypothetical protein